MTNPNIRPQYQESDPNVVRIKWKHEVRHEEVKAGGMRRVVRNRNRNRKKRKVLAGMRRKYGNIRRRVHIKMGSPPLMEVLGIYYIKE